MASFLYRILKSGEKEIANITQLGKNLEQFGKELGLPEIPSNYIVRRGTSIFYGKHNSLDVLHELKQGNFKSAVKMLYPSVNIVPHPIIQMLEKQMKNLPEFHIGKFERSSDVLKSKLLESMHQSDIDLITKDPNFVMNEAFLKRNPRMKTALDYIGKTFKSMKSFTGTVVVFGGIVTYEAINAHQKKMAGCYRFVVDEFDGTVKACRIAACSCFNGNINDSNAHNMCTHDTESEIPKAMKNLKNCTENPQQGFYCIECPPTKPGDPNNSSANSDKITYKCMCTSWIEAFSDVVNNARENVTTAVETVAKETFSLLKLTISIVKIIIVSFMVVCIGLMFSYLYKYVKKDEMLHGSLSGDQSMLLSTKTSQ